MTGAEAPLLPAAPERTIDRKKRELSLYLFPYHINHEVSRGKRDQNQMAHARNPRQATTPVKMVTITR